jgi:dTDP-glucose 4,6-dehydratase
MIEKIPHRKAHDFRYSINNKKLRSTGFKYKHTNLDKEIKDLCKWYEENEDWWRKLKND